LQGFSCRLQVEVNSEKSEVYPFLLLLQNDRILLNSKGISQYSKGHLLLFIPYCTWQEQQEQQEQEQSWLDLGR